MHNPLFSAYSGEKLELDGVVGEIEKFVSSDETRRYKLFVGTDSEKNGNGTTEFVTAIVIYRVGNGGRYFWKRTEKGPFYILRDRIVQEVLFSLEAGRELVEALRQSEAVKEFHIEIHADIGENGATRTMMQEVIGMIRAYNFEPKTKPESYAASSVADKYT